MSKDKKTHKRTEKCFISIDRMAYELGFSSKTVERSIKILEGLGVIIDETPTRRNRPHVYRDTMTAGKVRVDRPKWKDLSDQQQVDQMHPSKKISQRFADKLEFVRDELEEQGDWTPEREARLEDKLNPARTPKAQATPWNEAVEEIREQRQFEAEKRA
jgi:DNA-binding transcriptional MocR family regulator